VEQEKSSSRTTERVGDAEDVDYRVRTEEAIAETLGQKKEKTGKRTEECEEVG